MHAPNPGITGTRQDSRYAVELTVDSSTAEALVASRVSNLSRGGMFIECPHPLPIDSQVEVCLRLGSAERPICVRGCVAWTHDMRKGSIRMLSGNGIRFTDLSAHDRARLESYLATLGHGTASSAASPGS